MGGIVGTFFIALWKAGIPIAVTSFLLMWWAMKHQYFGTITSLKELELRVKQHNKSRKEVKKQQKKLKKGVKTNPDALKEFEANLEPTRKMNLAHNPRIAFHR